MQINSNQAVHASHLQKVGNQLGANGGAGANLTVLPGITIIGNNRSYMQSAGTFKRIQHNAQLHNIKIGGSTSRLNDINITTTNVVTHFHADFAVAKSLAKHRGKRPAQMLGNSFCQRWVGCAC